MDDLNNNFDQLILESDDEDQDFSSVPEAPLAAVESDSDDDSDIEEEDEAGTSMQWSSTITAQNQFVFDDASGIQDERLFDYRQPMDFWRTFLTDELIQLILRESNRYGMAKYPDWKMLDQDELFKFFAICMQMGLEIRSNMKDYWSTRRIFSASFAAKLISRNRFIQILNGLHFADNNLDDRTNRLYKIQPVLDILNEAFEKAYRPGKDVCIDESMVPFRGRVIFRQYIHGKRHKYGIKLYKLCCRGGYTSKFIVYAGRQTHRTCPASEQVVLDLIDSYSDKGRTLTADNFYSSISLAEKLRDRKTHYVGTLRKNRQGIPKDVKDAKLKRGDIIARQNQDGITVLKWKDKRELFMLSSYHDDRRGESNKPLMVEDYNKAKAFVDVSDQMTAYTPFIRKSTKWYLRLFFHLTTQTAIVNAWHIFCEVNGKIGVKEFKAKIIESILDNQTAPNLPPRPNLVAVDGPRRSTRRRCVMCYKNMTRSQSTPYARSHAPRVNTKCSSCGDYICLKCFQSNHRRCSI